MINHPQPKDPTVSFLHRCVASVEDPTGRNTDPDVHVFFEVIPLVTPVEHVIKLLSDAWFTPSEHVIVYNVISEEALLRHWAVGGAVTGDARLLEVGTGDDGTIHYAPPERVLTFVSPKTLQRLAHAQRDAQNLHATGYRVPYVRRATDAKVAA